MKKETPEILREIYTTNFINRYSRKKLNSVQTVSSHTHFVSILVDIIGNLENIRREKKDLPRIDMLCALRKAVWHDIGEIYTSDIPEPIKERMGDMVESIERECVEEELLKKIDKSIQDRTKEAILECKVGLEGKLVDLCDLTERLLYIYYEKRTGNTLLMGAFDRTLTKIDELDYEDEFPECKRLLRFLEREIRKND